MKKILYLLLSIASSILSLTFIVILFDVIINSSKYDAIISNIVKCIILGGIFIYLTIIFIKKYIKLNKVSKETKRKKKLEKQAMIEKNRIEEQKKLEEEERKRKEFLKRGAELFPSDYIVFDLETTGLSPRNDKIIEIGAIKYKDNEKCEEFDVLINPQLKLPTNIIYLTGITDDMLKDCETIDKVLPKFITFIEDLPLIAHNSSFDRDFIFYKSEELGIERITNKNIDTLDLSKRYITGVINYKLPTLKRHLGIENESHRSIADCESANAVFQHCKTIYYGQEN